MSAAGYWLNCDGCGRLLFSSDRCGCSAELVDHVDDVTRGFVVSLDRDGAVGWCSDWATLAAAHARGQLGDAVRHVHHGPGTFGAVTYYVPEGTTCGGCVLSCDVVDAVIRPYGGRERSVVFVEWDVMGDSRSFVPVCETCADWYEQTRTLQLGAVRS